MPVFTATQLIIAKNWKQPRCQTTEECLSKFWYIYTMTYHSSIKNTELTYFTPSWMELEGTMLREISQKVRDEYKIILLANGCLQ